MGKTVPRTGAICCPCTVRTTDFGIFTMLRMVSIGNTTSCPDTATRMAFETNRLAGSSIRQLVPFPISLSMCTTPCKASTALRTTSMPTPRPDRAVTLSMVEKPARRIILKAASSSIAATALPVSKPFSTARLLSFSASKPLPSSFTSITTLEPRV